MEWSESREIQRPKSDNINKKQTDIGQLLLFITILFYNFWLKLKLEYTMFMNSFVVDAVSF